MISVQRLQNMKYLVFMSTFKISTIYLVIISVEKKLPMQKFETLEDQFSEPIEISVITMKVWPLFRKSEFFSWYMISLQKIFKRCFQIKNLLPKKKLNFPIDLCAKTSDHEVCSCSLQVDVQNFDNSSCDYFCWKKNFLKIWKFRRPIFRTNRNLHHHHESMTSLSKK